MRVDRNELVQLAGLFAMLFGGRKKVKVILDYVGDAVAAYDTVRSIRIKIAGAAAVGTIDPDGTHTAGVPLTLSADEVVKLDHALAVLDMAARQIKAVTSKD